MIDLDKPVWFYNDTKDQDDLMRLMEVLWQNEQFVLCKVLRHEYSEDLPQSLDPMTWPTYEIDQPILFDRVTEDVINEDYSFWNADNNISWWRPFGWDE